MSKFVGQAYEDGMLDITGAEMVEIQISEGPDKTCVVHVSTERGTVLRICRIDKLMLVDNTQVPGSGRVQ